MSNCQMNYTEILFVRTTYSEVLRVAAAVQNKEVRDGFRALSHLRRRRQAPLPEGERMGFSLRPHRTNQRGRRKNIQCNAGNLRSPCNAIINHTIPAIPCKYHAISFESFEFSFHFGSKRFFPALVITAILILLT